MTSPLFRWIQVLRWPLKLFVKSKLVPKDPCSELGIDRTKPIVYVLKNESASDLLALERVCQQLAIPAPTEKITINGNTIPRYFCIQGRKPLYVKQDDSEKFITRFSEFIGLIRADTEQDVQVVPVSLFWGRKPGRTDDSVTSAVLQRENASWLRKMMMIIFLGRDNFVRFSRPISMQTLLEKRGSDEQVAHKLSRLARFHFHRQAQTMLGPKLLYRASLERNLLQSAALQSVMKDYGEQKNKTKEEVEQEVRDFIDEIAADYSERVLRICDRVLTWLWNKLYKGVNITNAERVRQLAQNGDEIVFVPCHRSHMDYLLLSYVIYRQGMVPPHIAAGINLSFWPAGPILRRGGAFFMRRSFRGNKLYAAVFREYLHQLFSNGHSVKYFTEGGRSRTGRLLAPKTGMIAMTVQGLLRGIDRPITLVPVYLGYDHVMEVSTYHSELKGKSKEKESMGQVVKTLRKLKNFGQAYVNFGEPIQLNKLLDDKVENWRDDIDTLAVQKPSWLTPVVNDIANNVMVNINNSAAVTSITLSALVLLGVERRITSKDALEKQLELYLQLLRKAPFMPDVTIPDVNGQQLLSQAIGLEKFTLSSDQLGEMVSLDVSGAVTMTYYRNNILHLFALPSLIAAIFIYKGSKTRAQLAEIIEPLYPLFQAEFFLGFEHDARESYINSVLAALIDLGLIELVDQQYRLISETRSQLFIMAQHIQETLERYAIVLKILERKPKIERAALSQESHALAQRLSKIHGINAAEFFDKQVLTTFISGLKEQDYLNDQVPAKSLEELATLVSSLMRPTVLATIRASLN
ncbi:MAG: glycerol-3-phosphate 1-O-acyltransferase PlsB [Gammaproteobacteria bacterium]|nr:glycerol-3-phosphate 1-O-acyltransferase PlsB [Gammaproteobacteria bacterium]